MKIVEPELRSPPGHFTNELSKGASRAANTVFVLHLVGTVAIAPLIPADPRTTFLAISLIAQFFLSALTWSKANETWFTPYFLVLAVAHLHHTALAVYWMVGPNLWDWPSTQLSRVALGEDPTTALNTAFHYSFLALGAMHVGALVGTRRNSTFGTKVLRPLRRIGRDHLRATGLIIMAGSLIPQIIYLRALLDARQEFTYAELASESLGLNLPLTALAPFCTSGALILLASARRRSLLLYSAVLVLTSTATVLLLIGDRGSAFLILAASVWLWDRERFRLRPINLALIAATLILIISPVVGQMRQAEGTGTLELSEVDGVRSFALRSVFMFGSTALTIPLTAELTDEAQQYRYFRPYTDAVVNIIPGFLRPDGLLDLENKGDVWLVREVAPSYASRGGGFGFSFAAEAYLSLGITGLILFPSLVGFLAARAFKTLSSIATTSASAAMALLLATILTWPRNVAVSYGRATLIYVVLPLFLAWLLSGGRTRTKVDPAK